MSTIIVDDVGVRQFVIWLVCFMWFDALARKTVFNVGFGVVARDKCIAEVVTLMSIYICM